MVDCQYHTSANTKAPPKSRKPALIDAKPINLSIIHCQAIATPFYSPMPISRKKACEQCRLSKTRCSLEPVCLRCSNRGLECKYAEGSFRVGPYNRPHSVGKEQDLSLSSTTEPHSGLFGLPGPGATSLGFVNFLGEEPTVYNTDVDNWDTYRDNQPQGTPWDQAIWSRCKVLRPPSLSGNSLQHEAPSGVTLNILPAAMLPWDILGGSQVGDTQPGASPAVTTDQSAEALATEKNLPQPGSSLASTEDERPIDFEDESTVAVYVKRYERLLAQRRSATAERPLMARILVGQVGNYPTMLIQGNRLPPFIFPRCVLNNRLSRHCTAANGTHQCLPEPLANCAALTQMFYSRSSGNAQFVWKTIYDEQNRLYREYRTYDEPKLLAAVQAVMIYILIQAQDTESIAIHDISALAVTLCDLSASLHFRGKYHLNIYQNTDLSQEAWAIYESTRRTINLFYVIRVVLGVEIGNTKHCSTLLATPLPSGRELWDSDAAETWAIRLHRYKNRMVSNRVLTIEDMLSYPGNNQLGMNNEIDGPVQKDLATWCESLDDFGMLVWMASLLDRQAI
ncbi:hypothetical protein GGR58DRAFT_100510 [Xylaria digitata]|nr:hypothetical protein GGR58DRAFT_100510 [Xylaria digitata]